MTRISDTQRRNAMPGGPRLTQTIITAKQYREGGWASAAPKTRAPKAPLVAPRHLPVVFEMTLDLPVPPTVNHCWSNVRGVGRVRSPKYRRWHKQACEEARLLGSGRIEGSYSILIQLGRLPHGSDVSNRSKPTADLLAGLITDDDVNCVRETAEWALDSVMPGRMRVTVKSEKRS